MAVFTRPRSRRQDHLDIVVLGGHLDLDKAGGFLQLDPACAAGSASVAAAALGNCATAAAAAAAAGGWDILIDVPSLVGVPPPHAAISAPQKTAMLIAVACPVFLGVTTLLGLDGERLGGTLWRACCKGHHLVGMKMLERVPCARVPDCLERDAVLASTSALPKPTYVRLRTESDAPDAAIEDVAAAAGACWPKLLMLGFVAELAVPRDKSEEEAPTPVT
eukprot:2633234-Amphidinium_carterae.2